MPILYINVIDSKVIGLLLLLLMIGKLKKVIIQKVTEATMLNTETTIVIDQAHPLPFNNP
jgi:hypothetical protein